jgi:predicted HicB family RNase H-like nuclease
MGATSLRAVPNQPKTPGSSVRIPPDLKVRVIAKAAAEGKNLTDVIIMKLTEYVDE